MPTIVHGTKQEVSITSEPIDAMVSDGTTTIKTPGKLTLARDKDHILTITKPGYETESVRIVHVISGAVAGNLLAGGFIGWGVDAISGAQWRLEPEALSVSLRPVRDGEKVSVATLGEKLNELDRLKEKNAITDEEYKSLREIALQSVDPEAQTNAS